MTLKQIQKIGFNNCDFESTFGSSNYYAEPIDEKISKTLLILRF